MEDPLKVVKEGTVKSTVERMKAVALIARKLIIDHVDDNVVAKLKSSAAASSGRTGPPPHFKSQPVNAPPPQSKLLDTTLEEILRFISPPIAESAMRDAMIAQLRDLVESVKSLGGGVTVEPYGSFVSELYTKWSDMDVSVFPVTGSKIKPTNSEHAHHVLHQIYETMRRSDSWFSVEYIGSARVPIVKGLSKLHHGTPCDVSFNNVKGVLKSKFLLWIGGIDSRFRPLVLLVKKWAESNDINSSREGTLNSYSLCLLVIFHLQTCIPSILPPLQEIYPRNASDDLKGARREAEERIEKIAMANIARFRLVSTSNTSSISDLLLSFFEKFSDINSKAIKFAVCTYTGSWVNITDNSRWCLHRIDTLFVEDPFDQPENPARGVWQLDKIADVFKTSSRKLRDPVTNREAIVGLLTGKSVLI